MIYDIQDLIKTEASKYNRVRVTVVYSTNDGFHYDRNYLFNDTDVTGKTEVYKKFIKDFSTTASCFWKVIGFNR